ncbi:MAG: hypothetical protein ACE5FW_01725 [Candidatus Aenigmatarchaeota archaeon]
MEGLPLKYITMILVAMLIVAAFVSITNLLSATAANATQTANGTLNEVLTQTLGNALKVNVTP